MPAETIGAAPNRASWARAALCSAVLAALAGCSWLPGCGCEEPPRPKEPPALTAPPAEPPAPAPAVAPPSLPTAPMPPAVTQAPLAPPPAAAPAQPALPPVVVAPSPRPALAAGTAQRWGAQLGAFRSLANASGAWERFKARYIDLLNNVPGPLLREVDLGPKGKFVRVMAGPFATEAEARSLCLEVLARSGFCYVQPLGR